MKRVTFAVVVAPEGPVTTPAFGAARPVVLITTFEDFQCPFCRTVGPAAERIVNAYPDDVQVHFRHRPLSFHALAVPLARATVAAHRQGRFKALKDLFFSRQHLFTKTADGKPAIDNHQFRTRLVNLAAELGLDRQRFAADLGVPEEGKRATADLGSKAVSDKLAQDNAKGILMGARGTPTVLVNGRKVRLAGSSQGNYEALMSEVRAERRMAQKLLESGMARHQVVPSLIAAHNPNTQNAAAWLLDNADVSAAKLANAVKNDKPRGSVPQEVFKVPVRKGAPYKGARDSALVTIVEFSDFQCPYCSKVVPTLNALVDEYPKDVRVAFLNLPLGFHKQARPAAEAALCAQEQGKFWEYHDAVFQNMAQLGSPETLDRLAKELGLEAAAFASCRTSGRHGKTVDADVKLANALSVRGTPHMFINGRRARGALPLDQLRAVVEEEIKKWGPVAAKAGRGDALYARILARGKATPGILAREKVTIDNTAAPRLGAAKAPVQVTVYSDFECPYCSKITAPLHDLTKALPRDVAVYFKHFPLSFHKRAEPAAVASICAQKQGKFWPFHDKIFGSDLSDESLDSAARFVGLDMAAYSSCKADPANKQRVAKDMAEGRAAKVRGTPSIFVNGRKFNGRANIATLKQAVAEAKKLN